MRTATPPTNVAPGFGGPARHLRYHAWNSACIWHSNADHFGTTDASSASTGASASDAAAAGVAGPGPNPVPALPPRRRRGPSHLGGGDPPGCRRRHRRTRSSRRRTIRRRSRRRRRWRSPGGARGAAEEDRRTCAAAGLEKPALHLKLALQPRSSRHPRHRTARPRHPTARPPHPRVRIGRHAHRGDDPGAARGPQRGADPADREEVLDLQQLRDLRTSSSPSPDSPPGA
mmetsp:Transcript_18515/g.46479  ORF Transcript_18515/g.46479 Transcript_18515/m.46479 type:complete len:230 (+) Transcript_18515:535-1224(+)